MILALVVGIWLHRRSGTYFEVEQLVDRKAYVTALARLDSIGKKSRHEKEAEYWYWRGRALMGNKAFDPGIDAYRSAISRSPDYRKEPTILRDAIDAVAMNPVTRPTPIPPAAAPANPRDSPLSTAAP